MDTKDILHNKLDLILHESITFNIEVIEDGIILSNKYTTVEYRLSDNNNIPPRDIIPIRKSSPIMDLGYSVVYINHTTPDGVYYFDIRNSNVHYYNTGREIKVISGDILTNVGDVNHSPHKKLLGTVEYIDNVISVLKGLKPTNRSDVVSCDGHLYYLGETAGINLLLSKAVGDLLDTNVVDIEVGNNIDAVCRTEDILSLVSNDRYGTITLATGIITIDPWMGSRYEPFQLNKSMVLKYRKSLRDMIETLNTKVELYNLSELGNNTITFNIVSGNYKARVKLEALNY